ncbi:MAG TPA: 30S ribosomal protein S9 [Candidatus Saccharimonadales bacterium]|nr:30S ribosomal protein S9 [Candidatus Saccharimonadales bacterium]
MAEKAKNYFYALGRRKSSTARVRLMNGKGVMTINSKPAAEYFGDSKSLLHELERPFIALEIENKYDVSAVVSGGGHSSQVDAIRLGIAKALAIMNEDLRSTLKRADMLGRDSREKERKKFGLKGARKQRQFTKR